MSPWAPHAPPTWTTVSGRGAIWSFVVPHPPLLPQFAELAPYNVVLVALVEDPTIRLVGNLVAREGGPINEVDPATIRDGGLVDPSLVVELQVLRALGALNARSVERALAVARRASRMAASESILQAEYLANLGPRRHFACVPLPRSKARIPSPALS